MEDTTPVRKPKNKEKIDLPTFEPAKELKEIEGAIVAAAYAALVIEKEVVKETKVITEDVIAELKKVITPKPNPTPISPPLPAPQSKGKEGAVEFYFGVDSVTPAFNTVAETGQSLFDYVTSLAGQKPTFWGRYIGDYAITPDEVKFLHANGCAILLVYNWTNAFMVSQGYQAGVNQAHLAINQAQALAVPQNVVIAIDIEASWPVNPNFIGGWSDTMRASNYYGAAMLYGNPNDGLFTPAYNKAFESYASMRQSPPALIWSNEPENIAPFPLPTWNPSYPSSNAKGTVVWQYAINQGVRGIIDLNLASQAGLDAMWHYIITVEIMYTCALKPEPNHECHSIKTLYGGSRAIMNYEIECTDPKTKQKEKWLNINVPEGPAKIKKGWVLQSEAKVISEV